MKASELINELKAFIDREGDQEVHVIGPGCGCCPDDYEDTPTFETVKDCGVSKWVLL